MYSWQRFVSVASKISVYFFVSIARDVISTSVKEMWYLV